MSAFPRFSSRFISRGGVLLGVGLLVGASLVSASASAAPSSQSSSCASAPVLDLANPSAGAVLSSGDYVVSGAAHDPNSSTGDGIERVALFLGPRDLGGTELGSGAPNNGAFQITAKLPSSVSGGADFVAYAHSSVTGQETIVTVPIFLGPEPTPTPRPDVGMATPVVPSSSQSTANCVAVSASAPLPATGVGVASVSPVVLQLANPGSGDVVLNGNYVISGSAYVPNAQGSGVDRVEFFLDSRESGGTFLGSTVPGQTQLNAAVPSNGFATTVEIPSRFAGGNTLYVYARNAATGQETVTSVPINIGASPTPTPRPASSTN